ncbi:unnamed protein product [Phytophthora fragariaefolia]|uniref:Unnamed protein product n=1 Tax=Phytophthora fragariaefolia TaxID=1490495 RepID=A0A9W6U9J2_9STRA|nr:unnamed protein product [Phytophthora fragariaefolia]
MRSLTIEIRLSSLLKEIKRLIEELKLVTNRGVNSQTTTKHPQDLDRVTGSARPLEVESEMNYPVETVPVSPRRELTIQRAISPNIFARGGGVILNVGMIDGMVISKSVTDGKAMAAMPTAGAFPRRRSRSASNSSQQRRDQILQSVSGKVDNVRDASGLQVSHIETSGLALRTAQDPNAPGYLLIPSAATSGKSREPYTVRAAAVAEAAASMTMSAASVSPRQTFAVQRTQYQRSSQYNSDGTALSVPGGATKNIPPNFLINNSSLTAPLMTIISSKAPAARDATSSINKIQLQFRDSSEPSAARPQTPYRGFLGASITSPRVSNAITAEAAAIFLSSQQKAIKPPSSPRHTFISAQRAGSVFNSEYQAPPSPRKPQQSQPDDGLSLLGTNPISNAATPAALTVNGRVAVHDAQNAVQRQSSALAGALTQLPSSVGSPSLLSTGDYGPLSAQTQPKEDLKALISPRYIVTNPVAPNSSAHLSPNLKQSIVRPQGSARGFTKSSPRMRSSLATGPASSHFQHQRQPSELQRFSIAPKHGYDAEASGLLWWDEELAQSRVPFRAIFFPALVRVCDSHLLPSELSREELRVVTQYCISPDVSQSDQVAKDDVSASSSANTLIYGERCS